MVLPTCPVCGALTSGRCPRQGDEAHLAAELASTRAGRRGAVKVAALDADAQAENVTQAEVEADPIRPPVKKGRKKS